MEFTLSDIDTIYREHIKTLDEKTRITYCEGIINRVQVNLNTSSYANPELNKHLQNTLLAAKNELIAILKSAV
jgi:hypothetical protein